MNQQFPPQSQFGAPPNNFAPMRPPPGSNDFNSQTNQPPGSFRPTTTIGPNKNVGQNLPGKNSPCKKKKHPDSH